MGTQAPDRQAQRLRSQWGRIQARNRQRGFGGATCSKCGRWLRNWSTPGRDEIVYFECNKRCRFRRSMTRDELTARLLAAAEADARRIIIA
jgi:hypothetical protein